MQMQVAANALIYEKSLRIPTTRSSDFSLGKVQNLMSADANRMYQLAFSIVTVLVAPLQIIGTAPYPIFCSSSRGICLSNPPSVCICTLPPPPPRSVLTCEVRTGCVAAVGLLIRVLGPTALVGLGVMLVFLPINAWIGAKVFGWQSSSPPLPLHPSLCQYVCSPRPWSFFFVPLLCFCGGENVHSFTEVNIQEGKRNFVSGGVLQCSWVGTGEHTQVLRCRDWGLLIKGSES